MSRFLSIIKKAWRGYCHILRLPFKIFNSSKVRMLIKRLYSRARIVFNYSFINRMIETKRVVDVETINKSLTIIQLIRFFKKLAKLALFYFSLSRIKKNANELVTAFSSSGLKSISIILITAVIINIFLTIFLLGEKIDFLGWSARVFLLSLAFIFMLIDASWINIKNNSIFLRIIFNKNVRDLRKDKS